MAAETVAKTSMEYWIAVVGIPSSTTTDHGMQFELALFTKLANVFGTNPSPFISRQWPGREFPPTIKGGPHCTWRPYKVDWALGQQLKREVTILPQKYFSRKCLLLPLTGPARGYQSGHSQHYPRQPRPGRKQRQRARLHSYYQ